MNMGPVGFCCSSAWVLFVYVVLVYCHGSYFRFMLNEPLCGYFGGHTKAEDFLENIEAYASVSKS